MTSPSEPCLIKILKQLGLRVLIVRRRLSRLKTRIQRAKKKNQPTTTLESQQEEEMSVDLERYEDLLNDFAEAIHERTGIPTSKLIEVATSTPDGEEWDYIYAKLNKLDEWGVNAEMWKALLSRDQDALISVGLLPSSESSPPATEMERQGSTMTDTESYPFCPGYDEVAPHEVANAVRLVLTDWESRNWDAVRFNVQAYYEERRLNPQKPLVDWTLSDIRQHYAQRNGLIIETLGTSATHTGATTPATSTEIRVSAEPPMIPRRTKRARTKKRWTVAEIESHIEQVLKSHNPEIIKAYVFEADKALAGRIGCNKQTLYKTRFWTDERERMQAEWRRLNTAGEIPKKRDQ